MSSTKVERSEALFDQLRMQMKFVSGKGNKEMKNVKNENNERQSKQVRLSDSEYRLMDILWDKEPVLATELAEICFEKYEWKKSTVYTMLKRMGDKDILRFENKMVESLVNRDEVNKSEGEALLHKGYGDSLPAFFAAFLEDRKLSKSEATKLKKMIEDASK